MQYIEQTTKFLGTRPSARQTMVNSFAVIGFVALIAFGILSAVYSTRFVPRAVDGIDNAAVYLGSLFVPSSRPSLSVVSTASTTIPFDDAASSSLVLPVASSTIPVTPAPKNKPVSVPTTAGNETSGVYQIGGTTTPVLSGLPDLQTTIDAVGYLATSSADSFIASQTVPAGSRAAVRFTIKNIGTNATGAWKWSASIPTTSNQIYQSSTQQSLNPGDYIDYTIGFDQTNKGSGQMISVSANFDNAVTESTTNNNNASATVTILGS